uniref:Uncharacterized protein n=1 Tax=Anguilla anguilla TaxID=7936 RepID=A0A0E9R4Q8_ANGAN
MMYSDSSMCILHQQMFFIGIKGINSFAMSV